MKTKFAIAIGLVLFLSACGSMLASKTQERKWYLDNGGVLVATQTHCDIDTAELINISGEATPRQRFHFIATNQAGATRGEWEAYCQPTVAHGTSGCSVQYLAGKARTFISEPDGGCAEFATFTLLKR